MPRSVIGGLFERTARERSDAVALYSSADGSLTTFADLASDVAAVERALIALGVDRGSAVVTLVGNRPIFLSIFVACMEAGVALVPVGQATDVEALALIEQAGAVTVISDRRIACPVVREQPLAAGVRIMRLPDPVAPPRYGTPAILKLTSGSTSIPKAAIASELHLVNDGDHIVEAMGIRADDINATYIPLSHSYALGNVVMPLITQGTAAALCPPFNPSQFFRDITAGAATVLPGVPFMFERLKSTGTIDRLPECLRLLITAGARIDPTVVSWFRDRLDRKIHSFYGSSETGGIAYDDSEDVFEPLPVGRAMPGTSIEIRTTDSTGIGRVFVAGNAVCAGYAHSDDAATSEFVDDGFLTGDLGYLTGGRLVLTGRVSPLVNVAGRKVDPGEVAAYLRALPGVSDANVLGVACGTRGQQLVAFIVRGDDRITPIAVRTACASSLSPHKIPRHIVIVDSLPLDERGKVDRDALLTRADNIVKLQGTA